MAADPITYYGASVNYEDPAGDPTVGWQIFHSDGDNVYLIADDYVHYTYMPPTKEGTVIPSEENASDYVFNTDVYTDYDGSSNV